MADNETVNVVIALDYPDDLLEQLRALSPRLHIERYPNDVPDKAWASADILYTGRTFPQPEQAPRLRWIQINSAGIDHALDEPILRRDRIEVTTASGIHATPISEYCLAMMLAFTYQLPKMLDLQAKAEWPTERWKVFAPRPLRGQTLGIVGYGNVGRELARVADALGIHVLAIKRDVMHPADDDSYHEPGTGDPDGDLPLRLYPPQAIGSMARECDFLVLTIPLTEETHHMVGAAVLKQMKKTAVLINVARGAVIDEAALIEALQSGRIGGAALDVFEQEPLPADSPLWKFDNVIISPHVAGNMSIYLEKAATLFAENLQRYLDNSPLLNQVQRERGY